MEQAEGKIQQALLLGAMKSLNETEKVTAFTSIQYYYHPKQEE